MRVWNNAMDLVLATYGLVAKLPATERFELGAQLRQAAVSVPPTLQKGMLAGRGGVISTT